MTDNQATFLFVLLVILTAGLSSCAGYQLGITDGKLDVCTAICEKKDL